MNVESTCEAKARAWVADYAKYVVLGPDPLLGAVGSVVELATMKAAIVAAVGGIYGEAESSGVTIPLAGLSQRIMGVLLSPMLGPLRAPVLHSLRVQAIEHVGAAVISHFEERNPGKLYGLRAVEGSSTKPQAGGPT